MKTAIILLTATCWFYTVKAQQPKLVIPIGHTNTINDASRSFDGNYIVTSSDDATVKVWETSSKKLLKTYTGNTTAVLAARFSPDGTRIASKCYDGVVKVWDFVTDKLLFSVQFNNGYIFDRSITFSKDGKILYVKLEDSVIKSYDGYSGKLLPDYVPRKNEPPGDLFSVANINWQTAEQKWFDKSFFESNKNVASIEDAIFTNNGKYIIAASGDSTIRMFDKYSGKLIYSMQHTSLVNHLEIQPYDSLFMTSYLDNSADNTITFWNINSGSFDKKINISNEFLTTTLVSSDGKIALASGGSGLSIYRIDEKKFEKLGGSDYAPSAAISYDSRFVIATRTDKIEMWDISSGKKLYTIVKDSEDFEEAAFSPDGKIIAVTHQSGTITIYNANDGKKIKSLSGHGDMINSFITFSPDSKKMMTVGPRSFELFVWDTQTWKILYKLEGHTAYIRCASFSKDGRYIVSGARDQTARTWDATNGKLLRVLSGHSGFLRSAVFSPDSKHVLTGCADGNIRLWDAASGNLLYSIVPFGKKDYLVTNPKAQFDGSEDARNKLYYVCGKEIIQLEQLKELCWEPELAAKMMGVNKDPVKAKSVNEIDICGRTARVINNGYSNGIYQFSILPGKGGLGDVMLFVNGKQIKNYKPADLIKQANGYMLKLNKSEIIDFLLPGQDNNVNVKAYTADGTLQGRGADEYVTGIDVPVTIPNLYAVCVGISNYKGNKLHLTFAAKDANDFSSALSQASKKLFNTDGIERVHIYTHNSDDGNKLKAFKNDIQKTFTDIAKLATANDILVIFFAGHGVLKSDKQFYYLTQEASAFDITGVEKEVAISTEELDNWMRKIKAQKQLMILDACNSGQAVTNLQELIAKREIPSDQKRALERLKDRTGTFILAASAANQSAYETSLYNQGLLTYSLLYGMKAGGGLRDNKFVDVTKWFNSAADNVSQLAKEIGGRQDPQILGQASFDVGIADKEVTDNINLSIKKKMFRRSRFIQDEELLNDDIELSSEVDKQLSDITSPGKESSLAFVADNTFIDAYSVRGRYEIKNNQVILKASLFKGQKERIFQFEQTGTVHKKQELAQRVVDTVNKWIESNQ